VQLAWLVTILVAGATNGGGANAEFAQKLDDYLRGYFAFRPGDATDLGLHDWDAKLPDLSRKSIDAELVRLNAALASFGAIDPAKLGKDERIDLRMLLASIQAEILELSEVRSWQHRPSYYTDKLSWAVFGLVKRNFAPLEQRMKLVIARESQIPALLATAQANLENPPRLWVEVALEDADGTIGFLRDDVPGAFKAVVDPALRAQLQTATDNAVAAAKAYRSFLQDKLLPTAHGNYVLGEATYRKKLADEEMVTTPIDQLIAIGEAELKRQQQRFVATARQIDPALTPAEVLKKLSRDHPTREKLIPETAALLGSLRDFCETHHIVGMPSEVLPIVAETPPFARAYSFASMDTPGPFETKATEAYFYETLPEPGWSAERTEEHLEAYWRGDIANTAIHEAYPGHYTQFLFLPRAPTKLRKILAANTFVEGWAHYTEEMLLEEGYGGGDPRLWLSQEQWALVRVARYLVGLRLHTRGMSFPDAVAFFEKEAYLPQANAEREAKRGTADPTYLVYTLGKLQIEKLRKDYAKKVGADFRLQTFHDTLLSQGAPPIAIVRQVMLGESAGNTL
jgi:uncharacterized protein (DUF885 family)